MALLASDPTIEHILKSVTLLGVGMSRKGFLSELERMVAGTWATPMRPHTTTSINASSACQRFALWRFTDKGIVLTARGNRVLKELRESQKK